LRDKRRKRAEMQERRKIYFHPSTFSFFDDLPLFFVFFSNSYFFPCLSHMVFFSLSFLYHLFCFLYFFTFLRGKKIEMGAKSKKKKHRKKEIHILINSLVFNALLCHPLRKQLFKQKAIIQT